jgi:hypothetical protein
VTAEEMELDSCPDYAAWCDARRDEWLAALDEEEMEAEAA